MQRMKIKVKMEEDILTIGETPQLIVNLKNQKNFIRVGQQMLPYRKKIVLSKDLLTGKRGQVLNTAINHYYRQACAVAEGMAAAKQYRAVMNTTVREVKETTL